MRTSGKNGCLLKVFVIAVSVIVGAVVAQMTMIMILAITYLFGLPYAVNTLFGITGLGFSLLTAILSFRYIYVYLKHLLGLGTED